MIRFFFFQAEDGIRDLVRSRGLGDVYKRQNLNKEDWSSSVEWWNCKDRFLFEWGWRGSNRPKGCLLYTSDAADERSSVDLGGRRIIKKKTYNVLGQWRSLSSVNNRRDRHRDNQSKSTRRDSTSS